MTAEQWMSREKMAAEMRQLEGEKCDLSIEVTFLKDKLKQARDESEARTLEADTLKLRIAKATQVLLRCKFVGHPRRQDPHVQGRK